jgi:VWFA-related protein
MFRSAVSVVALDVSVFDKNRQPVRGLTAADFTVLEDGKPQPVVAFSAVDVPDAPAAPPTAKWMRDVTPDVQTNVVAQAPEGRLFVLLLDDALMPLDPAVAETAKKIARSVIDRLSPGDQVAVVFSAHSEGSQNFTSDRAKLLKAVDTLHTGSAGYAMGWDSAVEIPGPPGSPVPIGWAVMIDGDANFRIASLRTLHDVADTLIAAPKRRKALIFVTPGVPVDPDAAMPADIVRTTKYGISRAPRDMNAQLTSDLPALYQAMRRANVTIYTIDPCGLDGINAFVKGAVQGLRAMSGKTSQPAPDQDWYGLWLIKDGPPRPYDVGQRVARQDLEFMQTAAANTGGKAIVNTNEYDTGIAQIFHENASYYVLGYDAPEKNQPGSTHRLTVKVNRPGVDVRTRSGYDMPAPDKIDEKHPAPSPTRKAVAGPVAAGDLPMEVALSPVAVPGRAEAAVAVALGVRQPAVTTRTVQTFQLQISIFTTDGKPRGVQNQTGQVTLVPAKDEARYELLTQVALKPGRYELRLATHIDASDTTASVYADVEVPDFAKIPLSLSGLMLEANPPLAGGPRSAFDGLLPLMPTSKRDFATTDQVSAFLQVKQGGEAPLAPVAVAMRIVNDHDATVFERAGTLAPEAFPAALRSASQRFMLPLSTLGPGAYLLTVEATLGKTTARRDVRFVVTR